MKYPEWSWSTWARMRFAGWYRERHVLSQVKLPDEVEIFPAAKQAIDEFGGLRIKMPHGTYTFDPSDTDLSSTDLMHFKDLVGQSAYPFGSFDGCDYCDLVLDESGVIYFISDEVLPFATHARKAIDNMVRSRRDTEVDFHHLGQRYVTIPWKRSLT